MNKIINNFFTKHNINASKKIIISIDLDNALVIRGKGSNYVNPEIKKIISSLIDGGQILLIPNTGREIIGFTSFKKQFLNCQNGILCSGSLVIYNDKMFFNEKSEIDPRIQEIFLSAVKNDLLPFVDFSYIDGRFIVYNEHGLQYKDLFLSQNPADWFEGHLPPRENINSLSEKNLNGVCRLEFPVMKAYKNHLALFMRLMDKYEDNIKQLEQLLNINGSEILKDYSVKKKFFFNDHYDKNEITFARLGKLTSFTNKGMGLRIWLEKAESHYHNHVMIHIGDQDTGLINDTLIKEEVPEALIVMVGEKCSLHNPTVDLYLRGDTEEYLLLFFRELLQRLKNV
ncbi:MAG: hypothetical protein Q8P20_07180 [bacterium]|nr:hypothetical protein [bacterium]